MNILSALLLIAVLVFIHEFGHFIVAKFCGVHCTILSIGYGRRLFGFEFGGTDYRLSIIPFGGYVRMAGADPFGDGREDDMWLENPEEAFMRQAVWKRLLIVAAGPAANLMLPVVVITALLMAGEPQPQASVGMVDWGSPAHDAGMLPGDIVESVNEQPVANWNQMYDALRTLGPDEHSLTISRDGNQQKLMFSFTGSDSFLGIGILRPNTIIGVDDPSSPAGRADLHTGDIIRRVGEKEVNDFVQLQKVLKSQIGPISLEVERNGSLESLIMTLDSTYAPVSSMELVGLDPRWGILPGTLFVQKLSAGEATSGWFSGCTPGELPPPPALVEGIEPGDRFLRLDGEVVHSWGDVITAVAGTMDGEGGSATARSIQVEVVRKGAVHSMDITPRIIQDTDDNGRYRFRPVLGAWRDGGYSTGPETRVFYSFSAAFDRAVRETWLISGFIVEQLIKLMTGEAAVQKSIGGPLEIVRQASVAAEKGIFHWVRLMAMLSISLGIVNLVPVPVLDGGQLLFYFVEAVRGRPLSVRVREYAQQFGVVFLVLLMMVVLVFDINRWMGG